MWPVRCLRRRTVRVHKVMLIAFSVIDILMVRSPHSALLLTGISLPSQPKAHTYMHATGMVRRCFQRRLALAAPTRVTLALAALALVQLPRPAPAADGSTPGTTPGSTPPFSPFNYGPTVVPQWFRGAKLGLFLHWGPVSQVGQELSYPLFCCPPDDVWCINRGSVEAPPPPLLLFQNRGPRVGSACVRACACACA